MRVFAQLFDEPAEIVVAHGRVVLTAFSLAAIAIDPTEPPQLAPLVEAVLMLYAAYSVGILYALHRRLIHNLNVVLSHGVDLGVVAILLFLTDGFSSPFLVFFTFALLAASLRWDWQGIAATIAMLVLIAVIIAVADYLFNGRISNVNQALIRMAYLVVTGTVLAYTSAHREHERSRLAKLAHWPAAAPEGTLAAAMTEVLGQAAAVLDASRALVVWEQEGVKPAAALWQGGGCHIIESSTDLPIVSVAPEIERLTFSRTAPDTDRINIINGSIRFIPEVLTGELMSRLRITDFSTAPFQGFAAKGRLFILGDIRRSDDHLPITQVVADRVGAELDRQIFVQRATQDAAMRARSAIMRDLHDGLLQNLTAARTQLELFAADDEKARIQLQSVRDLLRIEQRRVREFVDSAVARDDEVAALETLRLHTEETAQLWGCDVSLALDPASAVVPRKTVNQLSLMVAEAVANAVRHGNANTVTVSVACRDRLLQVEVRDDGHGFPNDVTANQPIEVAEAQLPRSLNARIKELGGQMSARTSDSGCVLQFELPS